MCKEWCLNSNKLTSPTCIVLFTNNDKAFKSDQENNIPMVTTTDLYIVIKSQ